MVKPTKHRGNERHTPRPKPEAKVQQPVLAEDLGDLDFDVSEEVAPSHVRLNKYLADHGVASRRKCDELIAAGKVTVNGEPTDELGQRVDPEKDVVEIDGVVLKPRGMRKRYYLLNKPSGVVCTNDVRETRPRAVDLISDPNKGRIYTVGRLDEESRGLILLTNDGDFANRIMHPRFGIEKTYLVRVAGSIDDKALEHVREGVHLSEGRTSGARILVNDRGRDSSSLTLTIHEGMNREIRRVFARVGYKVTELNRIRIGPLHARGLKPGRWRELLNSEIKALQSGTNETGDDASEVLRRGKKRFPKKQGFAREVFGSGKHVHVGGPRRDSGGSGRGGERDRSRGGRGGTRGASEWARGPGREDSRSGNERPRKAGRDGAYGGGGGTRSGSRAGAHSDRSSARGERGDAGGSRGTSRREARGAKRIGSSRPGSAKSPAAKFAGGGSKSAGARSKPSTRSGRGSRGAAR